VGAVSALAIDFDGAFGDTRPLWRAWLADAARRYRINGLEPLADDPATAVTELDVRLANWRTLLERFAEEHAAVHLRPRGDVSAAMRRLQEAGVRLGAFTASPEPLARVAAAQLGVARRLDALETGAGGLERLRTRLGDDARLVRTAPELVEAAE
jgi:phosphoglycolate phosphatase-like HAD superfamily hydrolase